MLATVAPNVFLPLGKRGNSTYWVSRKRMKPMQKTILPMFERNSENETGHRSDATNAG